jgi:hypothetical protein
MFDCGYPVRCPAPALFQIGGIMLTSDEIRAERSIDFKYLGRFLGIADCVGEVRDSVIIQSLRDTLREYNEEISSLTSARDKAGA